MLSLLLFLPLLCPNLGRVWARANSIHKSLSPLGRRYQTTTLLREVRLTYPLSACQLTQAKHVQTALHLRQLPP
ncbi:hypothetical protein F5Y17DRAFT_444845 [Xylariaceae sp. FL0594]|nr:hypothetical protein F5Y17DRAFT_444845 [Xylariaceae sp. FL0594]